MNEQERKHAAEVMASNGPWEYRALNGDKWLPCPHPVWSWHGYEYRVAIPAPEVRCPVCQSEATRFLNRADGWHICKVCGPEFDPAAVKPCPECAKAKAELAKAQAERDEYQARCHEARQLIEAKAPHGSLSFFYARTACAILRGEDRG